MQNEIYFYLCRPMTLHDPVPAFRSGNDNYRPSVRAWRASAEKLGLV